MPFPSGTYVNEIRRLGARIADEFDHLYAQLEGWLRKQHKEDGSHGAITADSVAVSGNGSVDGDLDVGGNLTIGPASNGVPIIATVPPVQSLGNYLMKFITNEDGLRKNIRVEKADGTPWGHVFFDASYFGLSAGSASIFRVEGLSGSPWFVVSDTVLSILAAEIQSGTVSPSQITANQNNYNPTSLSSARTLHLSSDAARDITGIAAQSEGFMLRLRNTGSFAITLRNASASSSAANQFVIGADTAIAADAVLNVQYASSKWRLA